MLRRLALVAVLLPVVGSAALANSTVTLRDREEAACYGDVRDLCGEFMPDVEKITTCMTIKRDKVSAGCAKYFEMDKIAN